MKAKQIKTLEQLKQAAEERRSVVVPHSTFSKPCSASFILNLQGWVLLRLFNSGMFIYKKPEKPKKAKPMTWQTRESEE